jgi:hypothetical protein
VYFSRNIPKIGRNSRKEPGASLSSYVYLLHYDRLNGIGGRGE